MKILVGTDGSPGSEKAIESASKLMSMTSSSLTIVHVVPTIPSTKEEVFELIKEELGSQEDIGQRYLKKGMEIAQKQGRKACVGNSARSQMAEAFFNSLAPKGWSASSAGTRPAERVSSKTIELMRELGLDLSDKTPKLLMPEMVAGADRIITMGCLDDASCPVFLLKNKAKIEDWAMRDPRGLPMEEYRGVRDAIKKKVVGLIADLGK